MAAAGTPTAGEPVPTPTSSKASTATVVVVVAGILVISVLGAVALSALMNNASQPGAWTPAQEAQANQVCLVNQSGPPPPGSNQQVSPEDVCRCWVTYVESRLPFSELDDRSPSARHRQVSLDAYRQCNP